MISRQPVATLTVILGLQALLVPLLRLEERRAAIPQVHLLPAEVGSWRLTEELAVDPVLLEYLKPDSVTVRNYTGTAPAGTVNLVVAYFRSLQSTYAPHSPKHCLPGAGWVAVSSSVTGLKLSADRLAGPVNLHILEKGKDRMVALYWYQNSRRVWASEFLGKLYLLPDLVRYRQTDAALVRITMLIPGATAGTAPLEEVPLSFARDIFPQVAERLAEAAY